MKTFYLAAATAALILTSSAAQAADSGKTVALEIDGQKIRIEVPKHCDALSCIQISAPGLSKSGFNLKNLSFGNPDNDDVADTKSTPAPAAAQPPSAATPGQTPVPATTTASSTPQTVASTAPGPVVHDVIPSALAPAPLPAAAAAPQSAPVAVAPAPTVAASTPIGVWRTEENKGDVRIEQCGQNLCGYAVSSGEKILINMRPEDSKWVGRIHDPNSGRNYDSTVAMKGPNALRVQGCALGGLFCGGQTWNRVS
jgi:uncharacterized protein (DUF2147 family)